MALQAVRELDLSTPYARCTLHLGTWLEVIGLALASRAGSRLANSSGIAVGRMTFLRRVAARPAPEAEVQRALGIGDFATRRGATYATVITNGETHQVIDGRASLIPAGRTRNGSGQRGARRPGSTSPDAAIPTGTPPSATTSRPSAPLLGLRRPGLRCRYTEGAVNRIKKTRTQLYERAGFRLLSPAPATMA